MDADKLWNLMYEQVKAKQFELGALTPGSWKSTSRHLKWAADRLYDFFYDAVLRDIKRNMRSIEELQSGQKVGGARELKGDELEDHLDGQLITVYFLLIGYAFENLLKAILMFEHPEYFRPDAKMKDIQSHDLVKLCGRCNISLQPQERNMLEKLTIYIEWQGKYPIPLESEKMFPIKQPDGSWKTRGEAFHGRETQVEVDKLYTNICGELEHRQE
jgi:hypothetical protein